MLSLGRQPSPLSVSYPIKGPEEMSLSLEAFLDFLSMPIFPTPVELPGLSQSVHHLRPPLMGVSIFAGPHTVSSPPADSQCTTMHILYQF